MVIKKAARIITIELIVAEKHTWKISNRKDSLELSYMWNPDRKINYHNANI